MAQHFTRIPPSLPGGGGRGGSAAKMLSRKSHLVLHCWRTARARQRCTTVLRQTHVPEKSRLNSHTKLADGSGTGQGAKAANSNILGGAMLAVTFNRTAVTFTVAFDKSMRLCPTAVPWLKSAHGPPKRICTLTVYCRTSCPNWRSSPMLTRSIAVGCEQQHNKAHSNHQFQLASHARCLVVHP
jgi:hypothetical protein